MTDLTTFDRLKGAALVCTFPGFLTTFAMWVSLWDQTWRIAVDPIRSQVYAASIPPSPCLKHSWLWWRETGCRLRPASASANAPIFIALEVLVSPSKEGTGLIGAAGAITKFIRLTFVRPVERFLAQVVSISTAPRAFVRERIHLGDTTNFFRAAGFFVSAISTAFLAEVATL